MSSITIRGQRMWVKTPYSADFVADLKADIPSVDRKWDKEEKVWIVSRQHLATVQNLIVACWGSEASVLHDIDGQAIFKPETRRVVIDYIARVKDDGYAKAWADNAWSVAFPEDVLRQWFDGGFHQKAKTQEPVRPTTLYALLGAKQDDDAENLKRAYRRTAMTHHPDRSREPDATERFQQIQAAWEILREPKSRAKYDAGLVLESYVRSQVEHPPTDWALKINRTSKYSYLPPVQCGTLTVVGVQGVSYFQVSQIQAWDDDVRVLGSMKFVRVSYWPKGSDKFVNKWEAL